MLETCVRDDLNRTAPRRMVVLHPLKIVLENYPEDREEELRAANYPKDEALGTRILVLTRELYIDRDDFREEAPSRFKRLVTGGEVRLRNAYVIRCHEVIKDGGGGEPIELRCTYDPATLESNPEGRKVRGVIHWVSARHGIAAEVRLYDRLFIHPTPDAGGEEGDYKAHLNPDSLRTLTHCWLEPSLASARPGECFQFEREGYFCVDPDHSRDRPVFNRTATLRDSWARIEQKTA
jgi:glutaminyl-tRNA synthetase